MTTQLFRCPTCGKSFAKQNTTAMPFCCERCRLIDLGRWLDEEHTAESLIREEAEREKQNSDRNDRERN